MPQTQRISELCISLSSFSPRAWPSSQRGCRDRAATHLPKVNTAKQVGDVDHIKVFATVEAAEIWFEENDPEGVAFEYDQLGLPSRRS